VTDLSGKFTPQGAPLPRLTLEALGNNGQRAEWNLTPPPNGKHYMVYFHVRNDPDGVMHIAMFPDYMKEIPQ
jgi:hypothetical protein